MKNNLKELFKKIDINPSNFLLDNILSKIELERIRIKKINLFVYSFFGVLSLAGSVFSAKYLIKGLISLGFFDYISLIFSNGAILISTWREYLFATLETLPILGLASFSLLLFLLFLSVKKIFYQFRISGVNATA